MSLPYRSWTRRDFLKIAGRAGLFGAFPTLASAAAALEPDTSLRLDHAHDGLAWPHFADVRLRRDC